MLNLSDSNGSADSQSTSEGLQQPQSISDPSNLEHPRDGKIPATVWQIGIMMCLMNLSYVIVYGISGLYLKHILGSSAMSIGFLEGLCETVSYLMKLFSGILSDWLRRRKFIMVIGYVFLVISKTLLALSTTFGSVFTAKVMERFGNGIQASPRDAIVADVAPRKRIGASYGLKRSLAYAGSFLGGAVGMLAMLWTNNNYQMVFAIAAIPAFIAFFILILLLKEPKRYAHPAASSTVPLPASKKHDKFSISNFKYLSKPFWIIIAVNTIFMLSRMNEQFLILRFNEGFVQNPAYAPVVMIFMNFGAVVASYPIGVLGDRLNRPKMLFIAILFLVLADYVMYLAPNIEMMFFGIVLWGLQVGASQNVFYSLIAEKVPEDLRGTGLGIYWLVNAIAAFFADNLAGFVGHHFALKYVFVTSGTIGIIALLTLALLLRYISPLKSLKKP